MCVTRREGVVREHANAQRAIAVATRPKRTRKKEAEDEKTLKMVLQAMRRVPRVVGSAGYVRWMAVS